MAAVLLQDIVSEDDVEAVMGLRRGPGQDRHLGSMISHFEDAIVAVRRRVPAARPGSLATGDRTATGGRS
jgi:hypothetical protein